MTYFYLLIAFVVGGLFYLFRQKSVISLTITDLAVFSFLFYSFLHTGIVQAFRCDPLVWFKWSAVALCYLFFRRLKKPRVVLYGIVLYGLFQAALAVGQSLSLFQSAHPVFSITGAIGHPGPLGGFLSIASVCGMGMFRAVPPQQRVHRLLLGIAALVLFAALLLTDSRAAFLSLPAGCLVVWGDRMGEMFKKHKIVTFLTVSLTIVLFCCSLYLYRPASADARILIWRVSAEMIAEKPLFGRGVGAFDREYMLYQAAYFDRYPQSSLAMVADNAAYPYNEWIHAAMELGTVGGCLLLAVFIAGWAFRSSGKVNRTLKAGLTSFVVFSCFSYPVEVVELLLLPAVLLGTLPGKPAYALAVHRRMKPAGTVLLAGILFLSIAGISVYRKMYGEVNQLAASGVPVPTPCCDRYFPVFKYNACFNMSYLPLLCRLPCHPDHWEKIQCLFPSSEAFCLLGEAGECCGQDDRAEQLYRQAASMVPGRILPNYRLWQLYVKRGDCERARAMAQKILSQALKVENTFTLQVKGEMKRYLELRVKN